MRLALPLGFFLALGLYVTTQCPPPGSAGSQPGTRACDASSPAPLAPPAPEERPKAKPSEKGKPRPPSPDALPTYEIVARACGLSDLLHLSLQP